MRIAATALGLLLALVTSSAACAQALWQNASYGMSVADVAKAFPNAEPPAKPDRLGTGAEGLLQIPHFDLVNHDFTVSFFFLHDKLEQVTLTLVGEDSFHATLGVFETLTEALRAKYGKELTNTVSRGSLKQARATWQVGQTNVTMLAMGVGDQAVMLNVNYQVSLGKEADKL